MPKRETVSIRSSELTKSQLRRLAEVWDTTQTEAFAIAVDRAYREPFMDWPTLQERAEVHGYSSASELLAYIASGEVITVLMSDEEWRALIEHLQTARHSLNEHSTLRSAIDALLYCAGEEPAGG